MNNLVTYLVPPASAQAGFLRRHSGRLRHHGRGSQLLLNEAQVRDLVLDLEIRFLANRDPNLYFALFTDPPDSDRRSGRTRRAGGSFAPV